MLVSMPPSCRSHGSEHSSTNPRNLAVFIDGTSNKPGDKNTNVRKLYNQVALIEPDFQQRYYIKGIGAYDTNGLPAPHRFGKKIYSLFEMAFALNVEKNVKDAYAWLVRTYREGDRIYLFGFSRGAYQVRELASMIHEVGLVKERDDGDAVDSAYRYYRSLDPYNTETRRNSTTFRNEFCWPDVRIHFVGVWDTVSSLGLMGTAAQITASATVTNACHFRHALALDECRVKFMPEYFAEVNAHHSNIKSQRTAISDVKEVWFAGSHADVGGTSREHHLMDGLFEKGDSEFYPVHAGNVSLLWMRREAAASGLILTQEEFTWGPDDVDRGRKDSMTPGWKLAEYWPFRQQVSFSGTGIRARRFHLSLSRSIIPDQRIHRSILYSDVYTPRAAFRDSVEIPTTMPGRASEELWATELPDEGATTRLLTSLLGDQQKTLESLEKVLFLLSSNSALLQTQWPGESIPKQHGFDKFVLTVVRDITSSFSVSEELLRGARESLRTILTTPSDLWDAFRAFYVLRFSARHETLRGRFIAHDEVIEAIVRALEWTAKSPNEKFYLFPLVMDSLRYLVNDDNLRDDVINRLCDGSDGTRQTRLRTALDVKAHIPLVASLKMITSLAQRRPDCCDELKPKLLELAEKERGPVGWAAVEALATLNVSLGGDIYFSNVLGYFGSVLPPLDAEVGSTSALDNTGDSLFVLQAMGSGRPDEAVLHKLVSTIESHDARERTAATLTLLKLCRDSTIHGFCSRVEVVHIFMKQMERKETSLLAAYALKTCLERGMMKPPDFNSAARHISTMLDKGWFDDAVGRVEGFEIFRGLMTFGDLREEVIVLNVVAILMKKLEGGDCHDVRTSLICLDILEKDSLVELKSFVEQSISDLTADGKKIQVKGVKRLAALARTKAGEQAIEPHVIDIVKMLLPSSTNLASRSPSRLFGPIAALYGLCKNETLREKILASKEFETLKRHRHDGTLHPRIRRPD